MKVNDGKWKEMEGNGREWKGINEMKGLYFANDF